MKKLLNVSGVQGKYVIVKYCGKGDPQYVWNQQVCRFFGDGVEEVNGACYQNPEENNDYECIEWGLEPEKYD